MSVLNEITKVLVKKIKEEKILSQSDLAQIMNVSPVSVTKWLKGGSFDVEKIPDLCRALKITPNELFNFNSDDLTQEDLDLLNKIKTNPPLMDVVKRY